MRLITIIAFIASVLFMLLGLVFSGRHPPKKVFNGIREFAGMLSKRSRELGFVKELERFVIKNGATYHYGKNTTCEKIFYLSLLMSLGVGYCLTKLSVSLGIVIGVFLLIGPWFLLPILNRTDNEKMLQDLKMIYHALAMQIKAGVYVTDALAECYFSVKNERLKDALLDLGGDIVMKADLFSALERFQSRFDNRYIDSLCITILQSLESGQASQLLSDLADQVRDMEKAVLEKRKGKLDRSLTFYQLGMLACILAVALYACVNYMLLAAVSL